MNVLITGGAGFIGFELAKSLHKAGNTVSILDINPDKYKWGIAKKLGMTRIKTNVSVLNFLAELQELGKDLDAVIHCAAQTAVTKSMIDPTKDFFYNAFGTFEVCEFARKNDLEIIYTSTNKVYGNNVNKVSLVERKTRYEFNGNFCIDETFPIDLTGHSPYGTSKLAGDLYVQDYHWTYGLKTNVFRMSCIYGASQRGTEDQGWVYHITNQIIKKEPITIFGNGKQVRDILDIRDLIRLFHLVLVSDKSTVINVGGGLDNTISLLELINIVSSQFWNLPVYPYLSYDDWRPSDQYVYISNYMKAYKLFGWEPEIDVETGIRDLVKGISKKNGIKNVNTL